MKNYWIAPRLILGAIFLAALSWLISGCAGGDVPFSSLGLSGNQFSPPGTLSDNEPGAGGTVGGGSGTLPGGSGSGGSGSGQSTPLQAATDHFTQAYNGKVDILWVIDNSGSMDEEQQNIAANARAFTDRLLAANTDFRVAVIATDPTTEATLRSVCKDGNGQRLNGDGIITPATASYFSSCPLLGTSGSGNEEGIESSRRALDVNFQCTIDGVPRPCNENFLRPDAPLHLVYVSDEEDQPNPLLGEVYGGTTVDQALLDLLKGADWWQSDLGDSGRGKDSREAYFPLLSSADSAVMTHERFLKELKPGQDVRVHSITLTSIAGGDTCHQRTNSEEVSKRYPWMAQKFGGTASDVCGDWSATMDSLGLSASGQQKCFKLSAKAEVIDQVLLNGLPDSSWSYDAMSNAVCFPDYPANGSTIDVNYQTL